MSTNKIASDLQTQVSSAAGDERVGVIVRHKPQVFMAHRAVTGAQVTHTLKRFPYTSLQVSP